MAVLAAIARSRPTGWETLAEVGILPNVRFVRILLKKSFWNDDRNFSGPLVRLARADLRGHIVSHKGHRDLSIGAEARCSISDG
jgi:hypothetical protein